MKYCTKCGAELFDEAVICVKCGSLVASAQTILQQPKVRKNPLGETIEAQLSTLQKIANLVLPLAAYVALFFEFLSIVFGRVSARMSYSSRSQSYNVSTDFFLNSDLNVVAFLFAILAFAAAITSFYVTIALRHRGEQLFSGMKRLTAGALLFLGALIAVVV